MSTLLVKTIRMGSSALATNTPTTYPRLSDASKRLESASIQSNAGSVMQSPVRHWAKCTVGAGMRKASWVTALLSQS